jgi:hypothetical protein
MARKAFFGCLISFLFYIPCLSQTPQSFKYQSVARNSDGQPLTNASIGLRMNIRSQTETGIILYQETHSVSTNALGIFSISVGKGQVVSGNFATIDWGSGPKFIDVEADFTGGSNYTSMGASQLLSVPYALYAENSKSGKNGLNILNGPTNPSPITGTDGEFYINTSTQTIFGPKTSGAWPAGILLVGPTGTAGTNGTNGINGLNVLNGTSDPTSGIGVNGEFYINTLSNKIFGPKTSGAWPAGISLVGPTGAGGTNGFNGFNVLNGTSDPTSGIGVNGEFYINTLSNKIFGPKTSGAWPAGVSLVGPTGAAGTNGTNGINGLNVLNGTSDPTSGIGVNGEFYINISSSKIFGPKTSGAWPAGVSLVGPSGTSTNAWGLSGNSGTVDGTNFIGTVDDVPINFKLDNLAAGRIDHTNVFLGLNTGRINTALTNVGIGGSSMYFNTTGAGNTASGFATLYSNTVGNNNSASGFQALYANSIGIQNTATGSDALFQNTTGNLNTADGAFALAYNTTGSSNTANGNDALGANRTGNNNTALGYQAGFTANPANANIAGSNNTFIGYNSGPGTSIQLTNATAIGYQSIVSSSNSLILGGTGADAVKVGIGVSSPAAALDVLGNIKIADGTQGMGKVLTSDASGVATWTTPGSSSGWSLTGNAGTIDGTNFIGTTDNLPLNFKVNNQLAGRIWQGELFLGIEAGKNNIGWGNIGLGENSLFSNSTGFDNTSIGYKTLYANTTGSDNTGIGYTALNSNTTGTWNAALGSGALSANTTGQQNTAVGFRALYSSATGTDNTALGARALENTSSGFNNTATGSSALYYNTTGSGNTANGMGALMANTTGMTNTAVGIQALALNTTGASSTAIGSQALYNNLTGDGNNAFGAFALFSNTTGSENIAVGNLALKFNTTGVNNMASGNFSLFENTIGSNNTAVGRASMQNNTSGSSNVSLGVEANSLNTTGNNNTSVGYQAGISAAFTQFNSTGSNNTFIGSNASPGTLTQLNNATAIGYQATVSSSNSLVLGGIGANAVKVGIGVSAPAATLDVLGNIKIADGTQGTGKVLTSDANGIATWTTPGSSSGWGLTGNAGTINGTNFIGTTDSQPLSFRTNNLLRARISTKGQLEIFNTGYSLFIGEGAGANDDLNNRANVFVGYLAGTANISGISNVGLGTESLFSNTTGNNNVALGMRALDKNISGYQNIGIGTQSLYNNTIGNDNIALGYFSLIGNTTGNNNISFGSFSHHYNTTGSDNVALGVFSSYFNTTGSRNISIGHQSLYSNTTGSSNTASGWQSLYSNTTGDLNTAYGYGTLSQNNIGKNNSAFGGFALLWNTTGQENTADGSYSLFNNSTGQSNTAVGFSALWANTTGGNNTATGWNSLYNNSLGTDNTATGRASLYFNTSGSANVGVGVGAAFSSTTGSNNTAIGFESLYGNTIGDNNTAVGYHALTSTASYTNSAAIGYNAQVTASNMIRLGDADVTSINGAVNFTVVSDRRFKKDISENVSGLPFIMKLRPVTYHMDMNEMAKFLNTPSNLRIKESEENKEKVLQTGFIAQEVEKAAQDLGYDFSGVDRPDSKDDFYGLRYSEFTVPLVKAVQEQQSMIDTLEKEVRLLKEQLSKSQVKQEELISENASLKETIDARLKRLEERVNVEAKK